MDKSKTALKIQTVAQFRNYPAVIFAKAFVAAVFLVLLVDPMSVQYLMGAEIDYKEDLQGAQFIIRNPNAQTTCGCGSSFSV